MMIDGGKRIVEMMHQFLPLLVLRGPAAAPIPGSPGLPVRVLDDAQAIAKGVFDGGNLDSPTYLSDRFELGCSEPQQSLELGPGIGNAP
jgi:hypothetical protein